MRVVRGREPTPTADRERSSALLDWVATEREPAVRVWRPHRQIAFGRRDTAAPGYEAAARTARRHGFPPVERDVGGRAVAYTGTTVAFARVVPISDPRGGLQDRYDAMVADVTDALDAVGVDADPGEPPDSFCPGDHSLQAGGKIVGIAQRVTADAAVVSGVLVVDQHDRIARVLNPVYEALGVPFDPATVGSVEQAGGDTDRIRDELEAVLVGEESVQVETLRRA